MLTVMREVYYCEFCKRHRMTKSAIQKHEPRCIYNPDRSVCGWHRPGFRIERPADHVAELRENLDVRWLRETMDGCPACMLAVVVQAGLTWQDRVDLQFEYSAEVERFRADEAVEHADF